MGARIEMTDEASGEPAKERLVFAYVTTGSRAEAEAIGRVLVAERLAACVNIFDGMTSIYRWNDAIETGREAVLIAKTTGRLFPILSERVSALHTYDVPCVLEVPVGRGSAGYVAWLLGGLADTGAG